MYIHQKYFCVITLGSESTNINTPPHSMPCTVNCHLSGYCDHDSDESGGYNFIPTAANPYDPVRVHGPPVHANSFDPVLGSLEELFDDPPVHDSQCDCVTCLPMDPADRWPPTQIVDAVLDQPVRRLMPVPSGHDVEVVEAAGVDWAVYQFEGKTIIQEL